MNGIDSKVTPWIAIPFKGQFNCWAECSRKNRWRPLIIWAGTAAVFIGASLQRANAQEDEDQPDVPALVTPEIRKAIDRGLQYLADDGVQNSDGSWGSKDRHAAAETSLSLMAFMRMGHFPGRGQHDKRLDEGLTYLINKGMSQGGFLGNPVRHGGMYEHALAIKALSQVWDRTKNREVRDALRRAVEITVRAQNAQGGWRYSQEPQDADLSMTAMHVIALNLAKQSGIAVPDKTIQRATDYVLSCQDPTSFGFKYMPNSGEPGFARTAAGVFALMSSGQTDHKATQRGLAFLSGFPSHKFHKHFPRFYYTHYYAIQVMYHTGEAGFQAWYPKTASVVLSNQRSNGAWASEHGDAYGTSMSILVLGAPFKSVRPRQE